VRTTGNIAISSVGNLQGSIKAVHLSSMQVISRDKFTILPMSLIKYLNGFIFLFGYDIQSYIEDNDVNMQAYSDTEYIIDQFVH
jgi:hypothetical protein